VKISAENCDLVCPETEIYNRLLSLDHKYILELGCGDAQKTRDIATSGVNRKITAMEVDEIAHNKNLQITDLPNVTFGLSGAQDIPLDDESVDVVLMFKSLHHIPTALMEQSLWEIRRVLKPGGLAYISEPVYAGEFNDILRLFNDEQEVREFAFHTLKKVVHDGLFRLVEEIFFSTPRRYEDFTEFENRMINATYSQNCLSEELYRQVKQRFEQHSGDNGAHFLNPVRVDLLQK
jgi:SAM-dependent methyltransferase